jgi:hypothetical protein
VLDAQRIEKLGGGLESQQIGIIPFQLTNGTGDMVWARSNFHREVLDVPFVVAPGIVIPPGEYTFDDLGLELDFSAYRKISGRITFIDGDFYDGKSRRVFGNIAWAPSPHFRTTYGFNVNMLRLPEGNFSTRIITAGFDVVFSSRLSWTNLLQYDNVSHVAGLNLRLNWIPQAGREVFFVINHNLLEIDQNNTFRSFSADAVAKVSYTFRF